MRKRQTVKVADVLAKVNHLLAHGGSLPATDTVSGEPLTTEQAYRLGAASVLESILHDSGNYQGFGYLNTSRDDDDAVVIPDKTRRAYYTSELTRKLAAAMNG